MDDKKGAIAIIATILASHDINLKNIGIEHNREETNGVLYIDFYTEEEKESAMEILNFHNYQIFS